MNKSSWGFYGRVQELADLATVLGRGRWFFLKISGRRRIGKTTLIRQALDASGRDRVVYVQIPDSDPTGVVSAARDFFDTFGVSDLQPNNLKGLAAAIGTLVRRGYIVALDEFQYFHRKQLFPFTSYLQSEVDQLSAAAEKVSGGLIVLGSLHTEMTALLEDRSAPLFNRTTDDIDLGHLDVASVLEILRVHADDTPERLLFLWNLFEGVPKFYRDCYEQEVLGSERTAVLEKLFFSSSSPLRTEADNWFLGELRGRYDPVLKYVARHPGCNNADVLAHIGSVEPERKKQVGGYLKVLDEKYHMIERRQPIFARPRSRNARFYLRDNFLRSWLGALSTAVSSVNFKPVDILVHDADQRLEVAEGYGLERLAAALYEERSKKNIGDFSLDHMVHGYWDRADTEIDLVAIDESDKRMRIGTCKRSPQRLIGDLANFAGHAALFLADFPRFDSWTVEKVAIAPRHSSETRRACERQGFLPQDLGDLTAGL